MIIGESLPTLADRLKRKDPDEAEAHLINVISQSNEVMEDAVIMEGNLDTGHTHKEVTGMPKGNFRKLNQGIDPEKSTVETVTNSCGSLEAKSQVDVDVAGIGGNVKAYRTNEAKLFTEGLGDSAAENFFYANDQLKKEEFMGLEPRFNKLSDDEKNSGYNIIDYGGNNDTNTSIYMVTWGAEQTAMIYPKGSNGGIEHDDMGVQLVKDENGREFRAYVDWYKWNLGLAVKDWRYSGRLANIDVPSLKAIGQSDDASKAFEMLLIDLVERRPKTNKGKTVLYAPRIVRAAIRKQIQNKPNGLFHIGEYGGKPATMFDDVPIKICDAILRNEQNVT